MKFEVIRENFSKALGIANKAISVKASLPILQNVLIESDSGQLKIVATDLDKSIITWVGAKIEGEGSITVPAKVLHTFVNGLKDEHIYGEIKGNNLFLKTDKAQASFNGTDAADYPAVDYTISEDHFLMDSDLLKRAVDETSFSTSQTDSSNPEWTGLLIKSKDSSLHVVGLDGYRLSKKSIPLEKLHKKNESFEEIIIPAKNFLEVIRLSSGDKQIKLDVQSARSTVVFDLDNVFFISKTLDGAFPDYDNVIPANHVTSFEINQEELYNAIRLSSVFAGDNNAVRINVYTDQNKIEVLSDNVELGNNKFDIPILEAAGDNIEVAFKAKYILDYLNNVPSEEVVVKISGQQSPAIFYPKGREDYIHIAVPLQPYWNEGETKK